MKKIKNLNDLFNTKGERLYTATEQELQELPNIESRVTSEALKKAINKQIGRTTQQQERLRSVFPNIHNNRKELAGKASPTITAEILRQSREINDATENGNIRDAAIINAMQSLSHSKVAEYGTLASYARQLGKDDTAKTLHHAVEEEKNIDHELSELAKSDINQKAREVTASTQ